MICEFAVQYALVQVEACNLLFAPPKLIDCAYGHNAPLQRQDGTACQSCAMVCNIAGDNMLEQQQYSVDEYILVLLTSGGGAY